MAKVAASIDSTTDWDVPALDLMQFGIEERMGIILNHGREAEAWLEQIQSHEGLEERQSRAGLARDVREAELRVLETLGEEVMMLSKERVRCIKVE